MSILKQVNNGVHRGLQNYPMAKANVVIGATTAAITNTGTLPVVIDGVIRNLAAVTNQALTALAIGDFTAARQTAMGGFYLQPAGYAGAFYTQPANTTVYYVVVVTEGGIVRVVQSTWAGQLVGSTVGPLAASMFGISAAGDGSIPDVPDFVTPIAYIKVASGGAIFTPGTTSLGTAAQTSGGVATIVDIAYLPAASRP